MLASAPKASACHPWMKPTNILAVVSISIKPELLVASYPSLNPKLPDLHHTQFAVHVQFKYCLCM